MANCFYCGRKIVRGNAHAKDSFHWDHVFPKSRFQELEHFDFNIVQCCGNCNHRKSNMWPTKWFEYMQEHDIYKEEYLDKIGLRMAYIVFEGIKRGYIDFDEFPLMWASYIDCKKQTEKRQEKQKRINVVLEIMKRYPQP